MEAQENKRIVVDAAQYNKALKHTRDVADFETSIAYDMANALEILLRDIWSRYDSIGGRVKRDKKYFFTEFIKTVKRACVMAESIEVDFLQAYDNDYNGVEMRRAEANELIRLILLYCDRTAKNGDNYVSIFNHIIDLKGEDIIHQADYDRFDFKPR